MLIFDRLGALNNLWKFDLVDDVWEHVSGRRHPNTRSNYTFPYPGGIGDHSMVIDSADDYLYIFGGQGYDNSSKGIH